MATTTQAGAPKPATSTPWGKATAVEEVSIPQRSGEKRFSTLVQLLETAGGERLVRFSYSTGRSVRRGPVTLRERDLARLHAALEGAPALRRALTEGAMD